jgi:aminoglycoside 6'-N-acetyltransferase I
VDRAHHLGEPVRIAEATPEDAEAWLELRLALWPGEGDRRDEFAAEIAALLAHPGDTVNLVARADTGEAMGFAEAALRRDYVEGCRTSPVAFLEGIYVAPDHRRKGVAAALISAVEDWGRRNGCTEFASDARIDNLDSHAMHRALGFEETNRVVYFRREIS